MEGGEGGTASAPCPRHPTVAPRIHHSAVDLLDLRQGWRGPPTSVSLGACARSPRERGPCPAGPRTQDLIPIQAEAKPHAEWGPATNQAGWSGRVQEGSMRSPRLQPQVGWSRRGDPFSPG